MSFYVGQRVVCVDDSNIELKWRIVKGQIYTISFIEYDFVDLLEVKCNNNEQANWFYWRFRPLRTTSIEVFQQMLINPPKELVG